MEGLLAVAQTPGGQLFLQLTSICICVWLATDLRSTRIRLYKRIEGVDDKITDHEKTCAERWGQIKEKLKLEA